MLISSPFGTFNPAFLKKESADGKPQYYANRDGNILIFDADVRGVLCKFWCDFCLLFVVLVMLRSVGGASSNDSTFRSGVSRVLLGARRFR